MSECRMCPRACGVDRGEGGRGFCGVGESFLVSRVGLHMWEEPPVSGTRGSGTIFFGGCNLRCVYCQNKAINGGALGRILTEDELERAVFSLAERGAHNISFVTPTHYTLPLARFLERIKPRLPIPTVWNTGGYDAVSSLKRLDGLIDIYLPDFKYARKETAAKYSSAPDYPEVALAAIGEMVRQTGDPVFDADGMIKRGTIVRHLVLPALRDESKEALKLLADFVGVSRIKVSLMSQYTPDFVDGEAFPELSRRVTSFEYNKVLAYAEKLGFDGYRQSRASATGSYTPDFTEEVTF